MPKKPAIKIPASMPELIARIEELEAEKSARRKRKTESMQKWRTKQRKKKQS